MIDHLDLRMQEIRDVMITIDLDQNVKQGNENDEEDDEENSKKKE